MQAINKLLTRIVAACDLVGTARAANYLTQRGYHKEARAVMLNYKSSLK